MSYQHAVYPPADSQYLVRVLFGDDEQQARAAAAALEALPMPQRLGAIVLCYQYFFN